MDAIMPHYWTTCLVQAWSQVLGQKLLTITLCIIILLSPVNSREKRDVAAKCKTCTDIVNNIIEVSDQIKFHYC
jgi:hypothetical protein